LVRSGDDAGARPVFMPSPANGELTALDDLIAQTAEHGTPGTDASLVTGILRWGPHFLWRMEERMLTDARIIESYKRSWTLFGAWLGGHLFTDDARELDWRARAGLELWRTESDVAAAFELHIAKCLLALPLGHELRDEERARSMIKAALGRAREAHDELEVLRCGRALLHMPRLTREEGSQLIDEGLAVLASLSDDAGPESAEAAAEWRFAAAFVLSLQGMEFEARPAHEEARALFERSLEVYESVMLRQQADPRAAITTVWRWGNLLMNAGYLEQAAETFAAVRDLDAPGSDLWWHATFEGGQVSADLCDWPRARGLLREIRESLLVNYAAWVCFPPRAAEPGLARLSDFSPATAQHELSEGMRALALAEAASGDWAESFRLLETTKALDYRQRMILRRPGLALGAAARTEGHSGWIHEVPVIEADDERAQLTAALARELQGPTIGQVTRSLAADQAVLSLGIAQGMWGMCAVAGDTEQPSGTLLRIDAGSVPWAEMLGKEQLAELFLGSGDIAGFDDALAGLLAQVDELIAAPVAELLHDRGIRHLTVIPDEWLNLLPVAALPSFAEVAVSTAASAQLMVNAPQAVELGSQALVVVDPVGDLPAAHAECAALNRSGMTGRLTLRSLSGAEATASAVSGALRGAGLFHFAGHGTGHAMYPGKAGLVMADEATGAKGGRLWKVDELEAESGALSSCALAVLSACESGRGGIRTDSISDFSGLPAALLALGVSAVVATLWRIPDDLGALFADIFYEKLAATETADLPWLVHATRLGLRELTGSEGAERLMALRAGVSDPTARVRLEAYARRLGRLGTRQPFAGPASWAAFHHTGVRYLRLPEPGKAS
jgi:CHAT domain-containing protein/tetratricopeptide (TPR) repeat protein